MRYGPERAGEKCLNPVVPHAQRRTSTPSLLLLLCFPYMRAEVYLLDSWIEPEKLQTDPESFQIPGQDGGGVIGWEIGIL